MILLNWLIKSIHSHFNMQCPYFDQCRLTIETINKADNGCTENVSTLKVPHKLDFSYSFLPISINHSNHKPDKLGTWLKWSATSSKNGGSYWYSFSCKRLLEQNDRYIKSRLLDIQITENKPWTTSERMDGKLFSNGLN